MLVQKDYKFWFCTGSQDLYGDECLAHVAEHSQIIVKALNESGILPYEVVWKPTLITNEVIRRTFNEANTDENCAGVITWCHTFSPAKSWILGLKELRKRAGLTQVQLAKQTGIAQTTLSGYENGRYDIHSMTLDNALRLSRALKCHPYELTDGWPD